MGFGFRVPGFGVWVSGFGFGVPGFEFRVSGFGLPLYFNCASDRVVGVASHGLLVKPRRYAQLRQPVVHVLHLM